MPLGQSNYNRLHTTQQKRQANNSNKAAGPGLGLGFGAAQAALETWAQSADLRGRC